MKLNVAVCDDEKIIANEICRLLLEFRPEYSVDIYYSGKDILECQKIYDLIFLDIEMPEINGIKTAENLRKRQNSEFIIFLTSHTEYMPEAFKVKAFRFLNKPIELADFNESVCEAEKEIFNNVKVSFVENGRTILININDIVCIEAFGDGTYIYTKQEVMSSNMPLKYWIQKLGNEHFYQVHRAYLVAFRYIKSIDADKVLMHYMKESIPIARRKRSGFKTIFFEYIKRNARCI